MFGYYLNLAVRSLKRNKALTLLMILTLGVGIGAAMTTLTVFRVLASDPVPGKSDRLFRVQLDFGPASDPSKEPHTDLSRFDAETLLAEKRGRAQVITAWSTAIYESGGESRPVEPFVADVRYASADFFPMFGVPMQFGRAWTGAEDGAAARVAVITPELNETFFGGADSTGKTIRVEGTAFRVIGVMAEWRPTPRYYDLNATPFGSTELAFVPYATSRALDWGVSGNMNCFTAAKTGKNTDLNMPCVWLQYWVELDGAAEVAAYRQYLVNYSQLQKTAGRFERDPNVRLRNVMDWLAYTKAVPSDVRLQLWLSLGFLLVCLVNVVGLLLAKFLRRSGEIGVRRALGARRRDVFLQMVTEAGVIGLCGGIAGLLLAYAGLWAVRSQPADYAWLAKMDLPMLLATFAAALLASLAASLLPAWRAMRITPAIQLKTQ